MLIKTILAEDYLKAGDLSDFGIREARRFLYVFADIKEVKGGVPLTSIKAIQTNISVEVGKTQVGEQMGVRTSNTTTVNIYCYVYDVYNPSDLPVVNFNSEVKNFIFTLQNAYAVNNISDFERNVGLSKDLGMYNTELSLNESMLDRLNNAWLDNTITIKPIYYTERQMYEKEGDLYDILWGNERLIYTGSELIDQNTTIELHDISTFHSLLPSELAILNEEYPIKGVNDLFKSDDADYNNLKHLIKGFFPSSGQGTFNGVVFDYDSKLGMNMYYTTDSPIPFASYRNFERMAGDLNYSKDIFKITCKRLEKKYGSLRVQYSSDLIGDAMKIKCDDYYPDNQPFNGGKTQKIDRGSSTADTLSDLVVTADELEGFIDELEFQTPFD